MDATHFIAAWEGFEPRPYYCAGNVKTIGFGRTTGDLDTPTTREEEWKWLQREVARRKRAVVELLGDHTADGLAGHQIDALVSFAYNVGLGALAKSTLLRKVQAGDFDGAAREFGRWVNAEGKRVRGLVLRRADERELFEFGDYDRGPRSASDVQVAREAPRRRPGEYPIGAEESGDPKDALGWVAGAFGPLAGAFNQFSEAWREFGSSVPDALVPLAIGALGIGIGAGLGVIAWRTYRQNRRSP